VAAELQEFGSNQEHKASKGRTLNEKERIKFHFNNLPDI
jgi:hypothetical protein